MSEQFLDCSFQPDGHVYRNRDGIVRPSVTQSLLAQGVFDFSMIKPDVLENARRRGQNAHRWCAEVDLHGFVDDTWIAEDELGYVEAWLKFRREIKPKMIAVEAPMLGLIGGIEVGGTPDVVAFIGAWEYIIDRKCCAARHPGWALQLADYHMLMTTRPRFGVRGRMSVQLFPTGKYSVLEYDGESDFDAAIAAVVLTEWDSQAHSYNSDHARETLNAWKANQKGLYANCNRH